MAGPSWEELDKQHGSAPPPAADAPPKTWRDTVANVGQTADDVVRTAADTLSFGLLDRALGGDEVKKTLEARERSPWATMGGDVIGSVLTPGAGLIGGAISRGIGAARTGVLPAVGRMLGYGTEGAVVGAGQAAGHTYDWESLPENLKTGAGVGAVGGAITGPLARPAAVPRAAVPSSAELGARGGQQLDAFRNTDIDYRPRPYFDAATDLEQRLIRQEGINPRNAPKVHTAIDDIRRGDIVPPPGATVRMEPHSIGATWEQLSAAQKAGGKEAIGGRQAKTMIDDFIRDPANLERGTRVQQQEAAELLRQGNANWAARSRARQIEGANERAVNASASAHSGLNFENTARQQIKNIVNKQGKADPLMGYNAAERRSVQDLIRRSTLPEFTRQAGNMLGGGGGLGAVVAAGAAGGAGLAGGQDPQTAALMSLAGLGAGRGLRVLGNRSMAREIDEATRAMRMRSPMFLERQAATPGMRAGPGHAYTPTRQTIEATKNAIVFELMRQQREKKEPLRITVNPNYR